MVSIWKLQIIMDHNLCSFVFFWLYFPIQPSGQLNRGTNSFLGQHNIGAISLFRANSTMGPTPPWGQLSFWANWDPLSILGFILKLAKILHNVKKWPNLSGFYLKWIFKCHNIFSRIWKNTVFTQLFVGKLSHRKNYKIRENLLTASSHENRTLSRAPFAISTSNSKHDFKRPMKFFQKQSA